MVKNEFKVGDKVRVAMDKFLPFWSGILTVEYVNTLVHCKHPKHGTGAFRADEIELVKKEKEIMKFKAGDKVRYNKTAYSAGEEYIIHSPRDDMEDAYWIHKKGKECYKDCWEYGDKFDLVESNEYVVIFDDTVLEGKIYPSLEAAKKGILHHIGDADYFDLDHFKIAKIEKNYRAICKQTVSYELEEIK